MLVFCLTVSFLGEDTDNATENRQTFIDISTFFESITSGSCRLSSLRSSQIDDVDIGDKLAFRLAGLFIDEPLLEDDSVDSVSAGGCGVHLCLPDRPIHVSDFKLPVNFLVAGNGHVRDTLNENACLLVLSDFEAFLRPLVGRHEQILHFLVVDLNHGHCDLALDFLVLVVLLQLRDSLEDFVAGSRYNSLVFAISNDRVTLSRTGLTVGEKARIVSFESIVQHFHPLLSERATMLEWCLI